MRVLAGGVLAGGTASLAAWLFGIPELADWNGNGISIQPNAALATVLSACALLLFGSGFVRAAAATGALIAAIGSLTLFEHATGRSLGIDHWLLFGQTWGQNGTVAPGRMGLPGATSWTLVGIAIARLGASRFPRLPVILAVVVATIAGVSLIGYLFGANVLYTLPRLTTIAMQTAVLLVATSFGIIAALPERDPMRTLIADSSSGALARRTLPTVVFLPIMLGWLRVRGQEAGYFDTAMGTALLVVGLIALLGTVLWRGVAVVREREESLAAAELARADADARHIAQVVESQRQLNLVTDNVPVLIAHCDREGRYKFVNRPYAERFGRSVEELIGQHIEDVVGTRAYRTFESYVRRALNGETVEFETEIPSDDASPQQLQVFYRPEFDGAGQVTGFMAAITNVTERRRSEMALRRAEDELRHALQIQAEELRVTGRRKDEFLAVLAHELRNPLAPLRNGIRILQAKAEDTGLPRHTLAMMERQLRHVVRMLDDLMDINRINRGKITLERRPASLADIVAQAVETSVGSSGRHVRVSHEDGSLHVDVDATRIVQVISNVLHNALKFSKGDTVVEMSTRRSGALAEIAVRDHGAGIPPELVESIFEMFTQVEPSGSRHTSGLGIGLALARRLSALDGGSIEATSDGPGHGSTFIIRLPLTGVAPTVEPSMAPAVPPASCHALVVDDNIDAADSLTLILKLAGHTVDVAYDGEACLARCEKRLPNVIFLDIGMPGRNGYEVCREVRQRWGAAVRVVALTGWGQLEDQRQSREAGFDAHLVKPVAPEAVAAEVAAAVVASRVM